MAGTTLSECHNQWATRPPDERHVSIPLARAYSHAQWQRSRVLTASLEDLSAFGAPETPEILMVKGPSGAYAMPTFHGFGQLAGVAGLMDRESEEKVTATRYLRQLPSPLAADCINYGLMLRREQEAQIMLRMEKDAQGTHPMLAAVLGPKYGRVWNYEVLDAIGERFGDGVTGAFRVPGIFGKPLEEVTKDATTIYVGDHDMFVFLADEVNRIEVPNRRDGKAGTLARGFFVRNSEVGAATLSVRSFLFDFVCCNRFVWGAQDVETISIRHTSGAPRRFVNEVAPALTAYAQSSAQGLTKLLEAARERVIVKSAETRKEDVIAFLKTRKFSTTKAEAIAQTHEVEEGRPIETLWDAATAITAYARGIPFADDRVMVEEQGGAVLRLAA